MFAMARRSYDMVFKLKAFAAADRGSKQAAARQFKIDANRVREWCSAAGTSSKLADLGCPNCPVDVLYMVTADNTGE